MTGVDLTGVRLDAYDVTLISTFWADLLGWRTEQRADGAVVVVPDAPSSYPLIVCATPISKRSQNRIHLDLTTGSSREMERLVSRAYGVGAADADVGQTPDEPHTVLADPESNEFCIIPPDNTFLADTGAIGAINCDGSQVVGYFWSDALEWPLVWDQDEETAIQAPAGGSKITWSGPPLMPRVGRDRLRLELSTSGSLSSAVERLQSLGARFGQDFVQGETVLYDPDGNEFHLVARHS